MVTVPILGKDLHPRDPNLNPSPLVEMSHNTDLTQGLIFYQVDAHIEQINF